MTRDDIADGYTGYVIWNQFRRESLDINEDLPMESIDSGLILLKEEGIINSKCELCNLGRI